MSFESFYAIYPRKVARQAAMKAYERALKSTTPEKIDEAARRYAHDRKLEDPKFTKHPATWLNAGCWADYDLALAWTKPEDEAIVVTNGQIWAKEGSAEMAAWDDYWIKTRGVHAPRNRNGGWWFPSALPPTGGTI